MKFSPLLYSTIIYMSSSLMQVESKVYTWVDEDGKTHFSDHAQPGTKEVVLQDTNLVSDDRKVAEKPVSAESPPVVEEKKKAILYQISILSPKNDVAIRANDGSFSVNVAINPKLEEEHMFQLYIDNMKVGAPQSSTTMLAENVDRGTHQVQVFLMDKKETIVAKTKIISVHLQRATNASIPGKVLPAIIGNKIIK